MAYAAATAAANRQAGMPGPAHAHATPAASAVAKAPAMQSLLASAGTTVEAALSTDIPYPRYKLPVLYTAASAANPGILI